MRANLVLRAALKQYMPPRQYPIRPVTGVPSASAASSRSRRFSSSLRPGIAAARGTMSSAGRSMPGNGSTAATLICHRSLRSRTMSS